MDVSEVRLQFLLCLQLIYYKPDTFKTKKKTRFQSFVVIIMWLQLWRSCGFSFWYDVDDYVCDDCVKWDIMVSSGVVHDLFSFSVARIRRATWMENQSIRKLCSLVQKYGRTSNLLCPSSLTTTYITPTQTNSSNYDCVCVCVCKHIFYLISLLGLLFGSDTIMFVC